MEASHHRDLLSLRHQTQNRGGGALLRGLEELLEEKTGINTMTAEDSMKCVAIGTGKFVEFMSGKRANAAPVPLTAPLPRYRSIAVTSLGAFTSKLSA